MKHATIKLGDYQIPLIGIPVDAALYECDCCHDIFPIEQLELNENGNQFLCCKCRKE